MLVVSDYRIEISQVDAEILFNDPVFKDLPRDRQLTITELCGDEELRPVIVGDIKYESYDDYLNRRRTNK